MVPGRQARPQGADARGRELIDVRTLTDGGQRAEDVARPLGEFLRAAERSLDIALYDLRLAPETARHVIDALAGAARRGVAVRLAYNLAHAKVVPVPPPPRTDPTLLESLRVPTLAIPGVPDLMHHKYVIRDRAHVWTGSTNWTDDSWTREENVIAVVASEPLAASFTADFEQLWSRRRVRKTGRVATRPVDVDGVPVRAWFCPKRGGKLARRIARAIGAAQTRVRVASPVITSGPILGALAAAVSAGKVDVAGVVDLTQIREVLHQWRTVESAGLKPELLHTILTHAPFSAKRSTPYSPGAVHDYMHAKVTVCDDTAFLGSFNLSRSGEQNAENVLEIADPAVAAQLAAFVDDIRGRYPPVELL